MRFVSKYPSLHLGAAVNEKFVVTFGGEREKQRDSIQVQFSQTGLTAADVKFALRHWQEKEFAGRYLLEDEVTQQPVVERVGVFDTDEQGYDDELRDHVEKWMLAKPNYGVDFTLVEKVPVAPPWPRYDDTHHFKIPKLAAELGLVEEAILYERETKNRQSVIDALEAENAPPPDGEPSELIAA